MAKLTLLSIVNTYFDLTDGDLVASIDDTHDAGQVASIAEKVFHDFVSGVFNGTVSSELRQLESIADSTKPNYLRLPDDILNIKGNKVMYNVALDTGTTLNLVEIPFVDPQKFLVLMGGRSTNQPNTQVVTDFSGYKFVIQNKTAPGFFTSFDDEHLMFDSFDSDVDSVMQSSKSGILTQRQRSFTRNDTYVIDLPEWFHTGYQNAVISLASESLRDEPIPSIARQARLDLLRARKKLRVGSVSRKINYGRSSNRTTSGRRRR